MVQFVLTLLLISSPQMTVDWSEMTVHFYAPVDLTRDTVAQSELLGSLDSLLAVIPLDAERTLGDAVARSRDAQNYYRTALAYPQVVSTRYSTASSGEVENEYAIRLLGPFISELIPPPSNAGLTSYHEPDTAQETIPSAIPSTGFIIDARGSGFQPGVFPRLLDPEGNVILDASMVERHGFVERGYVKYAYSPRDALQTRELGLNPLRLVAERVSGRNRCDIILSAADAEQITGSALNQRLLSEGRTIIIVDPN